MTFDEGQLPQGTSSFILQWTAANPFVAVPGSGTVTTTATNTWTQATGSSPLGAWVANGDATANPSGPNGTIQRMPMNPYTLYEFYNKYAYSVPVVSESKTIAVAGSNVNIGTTDYPNLPSMIVAWGESHHYSYDSGSTPTSAMTAPNGPTLPIQSFWFQSRSLPSGLFFAPNHGLTGIAHCDSLLFASDLYQGFVIPAFLDGIAVDTRTINVPIN